MQFFQESGGVLAIHLGVMELEGDGQRRLQPTFAVAAPRQKGIVEDATILVGDAVEFRARDCRCADDDGFVVQDVLAGLADGLCQVQVVGIKRLQIVGDGHVTEAQSALDVISYHIDGHAIVSVQFPVLWQHIELLNL